MTEIAHPEPLRTDERGRVIVTIVGSLAWVVDKIGRHHLLAHPGLQLGRHLDVDTDPVFSLLVTADKYLNIKQ
jgi:hypothetical protein